MNTYNVGEGRMYSTDPMKIHWAPGMCDDECLYTGTSTLELGQAAQEKLSKLSPEKQEKALHALAMVAHGFVAYLDQVAEMAEYGDDLFDYAYNALVSGVTIGGSSVMNIKAQAPDIQRRRRAQSN